MNKEERKYRITMKIFLVGIICFAILFIATLFKDTRILINFLVLPMYMWIDRLGINIFTGEKLNEFIITWIFLGFLIFNIIGYIICWNKAKRCHID